MTFKVRSLSDLTPGVVTTGQKVAYVTDALYDQTNAERIVRLAWGADHLFIEAVFSEELKDRAAQKYHLTAHQAGTLACRARVKYAVPFHFSPIYQDRGVELLLEFDHAFHGEA